MFRKAGKNFIIASIASSLIYALLSIKTPVGFIYRRPVAYDMNCNGLIDHVDIKNALIVYGENGQDTLKQVLSTERFIIYPERSVKELEEIFGKMDLVEGGYNAEIPK